jgi:hypothetical protein
MRTAIFTRGTRLAFAAALTVGGLGVGTAQAVTVTYGIDFSGGLGTVLGSFRAEATGGAVTNLTGTLSGVTFDTMLPGTTSFEYDPAINEFTYAGAFPSFTNSGNYGICAAGGCFLEFYPDPDPLVPGDYLAVDALLNNIDAGTKYVIVPPSPGPAPIPLPGALGLLAGGIGALGLAAGRRRLRPA